MNEKGKCRGYGVEKNVSCEEYRISGAALNVFERGARRFEIEMVDVHGQGHVLCGAKDANHLKDEPHAESSRIGAGSKLIQCSKEGKIVFGYI